MNIIKIRDDIKSWLKEDMQFWDFSSRFIVDENCTVRVIAKSDGIISGTMIVQELCNMVDINILEIVHEGEKVRKGDELIVLEGNSTTILQIERTMLNIVSHMSGISTLTYTMLEMVRQYNDSIRIAATRKTLPGLRMYQKWAVAMGGGDTHRMSLSSMIMLKENHLSMLGGIENGVEFVKENSSFSLKIEVEVRTDEEAILAAKSGVDIIMLDNYTPEMVRNILPKLREINDKILVEASGNINENTIVDYAKSEVDIISMGKLTHSSTVFDMSLIFDNVKTI